MIPAKNNIIVQIQGSTPAEYAIMNPITGSFDLMGEREHAWFTADEPRPRLDHDTLDYFLERGYAYLDSQGEQQAIGRAYAEFSAEVEDGQVQLMLVPTYGCNLACTYCFQHGIDGRPQLITKEIVDAFFAYARENFSTRSQKPFVTLFGGEPLVNSPAQREIVEYILDGCAREGYEFAAVTNGYDFVDYVDSLKKVSVKEIQFTLDGGKAVHDQRRITHNKKGSFDHVVAGIAAAVAAGIPINLRSVVDRENINDLVSLAEYCEAQGWLDLPPELFKTQIGRNYELFECYVKPQHLMTQVELWAEYAALAKAHPVLARFHRPNFKGIRHLVDTGDLYLASFDTCPAAKTEWVFDLYGEIYGCTASCGREEYRLGRYWPVVEKNNAAIENWQSRNVTTIEKCRSCSYNVICGGGCGVVAANHNSLDIHTPDCRPIQELLEIGVNFYADEIRAMAEEATGSNDLAQTETITIETPVVHLAGISAPSGGTAQAPSAGSASQPEHHTDGCLFCGTELLYNDKPQTVTCGICGGAFESTIVCPEGHFVCDTCHSLDILDQVELFLAGSSDSDPVRLAQSIFELPGLNMHGPEYHSIAPAIIVAAWQNQAGQRDRAQIHEAIRRGRVIPGGACGSYGACGAALGAGVAYSIIESVTALSSTSRADANLATAAALTAIAGHGGPRCCKRETITTIQAFARSTELFAADSLAPYTCHQCGRMKECIGTRCPFHPAHQN